MIVIQDKQTIRKKIVTMRKIFTGESCIYVLNCLSTVNSYALKYIKQKVRELQEEINKSTVIIEDFNKFLCEMDTSSKQQHT